MRQGEPIFVDSVAWIALALTRAPLHQRATELWLAIKDNGLKLRTSVPVMLETFTFLERNAARDVALAWKDSVTALSRIRLLECRPKDLAMCWSYFERRDLHKLSATDATSFVIMKREKIGIAFSFDHYFSVVGFRLAG
jgi:predicted nucleic acid-binding protein